MARVSIRGNQSYYKTRPVYSRSPRFWIYPQHSKKVAVKDSKLPKPATTFKPPYVADNAGKRDSAKWDKEPSAVNVNRQRSWERR